MTQIAQDRLAILAAEVEFDRLNGREILGIRRFSMRGKMLAADIQHVD